MFSNESDTVTSMAKDHVSTFIRDSKFGELGIQLNRSKGLLAIEGHNLPPSPSSLRRFGTAAVEDWIPIGTRDGKSLELIVDGSTAKISPSKGGLSRRSFKVDAEFAGVAYRMMPNAILGSKLLKDRNHLGDFTYIDWVVSVEWRDDVAISPTDAVIGYLLAAAFGTGAEATWKVAIEAILGGTTVR